MLNFDIKTIINKTPYHFKASLKSSQIHSIIGDSGSGKSTLLNMLIGYIPIEEGFIHFNEKIIFDSSKNVNIQSDKRSIAYVHQSLLLFENMSLEENISYSIKDKTQINKQLEKFDLIEVAKQKIQTLSGGQKAKCAIIRSILSKYDVLLLDEPLASLDTKSKEIYKQEFKSIAKHQNKCIIFVSHNLKDIYDITNNIYKVEDKKLHKVNNSLNKNLNLKHIKDDLFYIENSFISLNEEEINKKKISIYLREPLKTQNK